MKISFILNGINVNTCFSPLKSLLFLLREEFHITSLKEACGRGSCGSCTVLLNGLAVPSCMVACGQLRSKNVVTLEGLKSNIIMKELQKSFLENGAAQCGFCTSGFLISSYALLMSNPSPSKKDIRLAISGNICRCTAYINIIDSVLLASGRINEIRTS